MLSNVTDYGNNDLDLMKPCGFGLLPAIPRFAPTLCVFLLPLIASAALAQPRQDGRNPAKASADTVGETPSKEHEGRVVETIFRQPTIETDGVDGCVIGEVPTASERFYVRIGNMGRGASAAPLSWDVGRYTGLRPAPVESLARYQRGPRQAGEGTAVQVRGQEIGIWIDSDHPRPQQGALLPVCPGYWWWRQSRAPSPFSETGRELSFSFDLKVPTAQRQGNAEVYICAHFQFLDRRSKRQFWFGASLFDLRGADRFRDVVHVDNWEGGTGLPILFAALDRRSKWLYPGPGSAEFADRPFNDYRRFDFRVGPAELRTAVAAMRKRLPKMADIISDNPSDYQLMHFNVNPEVYAPEGSRGRLGLALRDIRVLLLAREREIR
jgi:hypothetical protein